MRSVRDRLGRLELATTSVGPRVRIVLPWKGDWSSMPRDGGGAVVIEPPSPGSRHYARWSHYLKTGEQLPPDLDAE